MADSALHTPIAPARAELAGRLPLGALATLTVFLAVATLVLTDGTPAADAGPAALVRGWDGDGLLTLGGFVKLAVAMLLVLLAARFAAVLRADGDTGAAPTVVALGGVVIAAGLTVDATLIFALTDGAATLDPGATAALNALHEALWSPFVIGTGLITGGIGISARRSGSLPGRMAAAGVALGVLAPLGPAGFVTFFGGAPFLIAAGVLLGRR